MKGDAGQQTRALERRLLAFVRERALLRPRERVLLMLSGGADSMALLALVRVADERLGLGLQLYALHVDYGMRGAESTRDRRIVEEACAAASVPLEIVHLENRLTGSAFEERARAVRYEAAGALARRARLSAIVTAHNRDDQAETVLYRLAKYASPSSLVGMRPRAALAGHGFMGSPELPLPRTRDTDSVAAASAAAATEIETIDLVRPLLCLGAAEVRAYCRARGISYGDDVTNADPAYARRNLIRHEVIPTLERVNPALTATLAESADMAAEERAALDALVASAWSRVVVGQGGDSAWLPVSEARSRHTVSAEALSSVLDVSALADEAPAVQALCVRRLLREVYGPYALVERRLLNSVLLLLRSTAGSKRVSLPGGLEAVREYDRLTVRRRDAAAHTCQPVVLAPGGDVLFCGRRCSAELLSAAPPPERLRENREEAFLGCLEPPKAIVLRHPRAGDRFQPLGLGATVSLAEFFSAAKVPVSQRAAAVVAEIAGVVAWVSPGRVAEPYRVHEVSPCVIRLSFQRA